MKAPHYPGKPVAAPAMPLLMATLLLASCATGGQAPMAVARHAAPAVPADPAAANAVSIRALSLVGSPYRFGGSSPATGFDCSGLVGYVFQDMVQRHLPRRSVDLATSGIAVGPEWMAAGDLVVFGDRAGVNHVGIYVGEGRFVHAPATGGSVRLDRLDGPYWREHFQGARRLLVQPLSRR